MIVSQSDIDLVLNARLRRRMLRLPASASPKAKCPLERGGVYHLQPRLFAAAQVTITVKDEPWREALADLSAGDAKREGYASSQGALEAWTRAHGRPQKDQLVWVIAFVVGDESEFLETGPVFLRRSGGYTTTFDELDAGEVLANAGAAEHARVMALATRRAPQRAAVKQAAEGIETLRESIESMKARALLKRAARTVEAAERVLLSESVLDSAVLAASDGSAGEADRPHSSDELASPGLQPTHG